MKSKLYLAALVTAAVLLSAPVGADATETAPLAAGVMGEESQPGEVRLPAFGSKRAYRQITVSSKWVNQARVGGLSLCMRLFTPGGDTVVFQQNVMQALSNPDGVCLALGAGEWEDDLLLQLDQGALNVLRRMGVTEIAVADENRYVRAVYQVDELCAVRAAYGISDAEQLCLAGENHPVTVVNEVGVRRRLTD